MSQRVLDEREHRRGLVLGLTLAEVLILLLFLLLLALGAGLAKTQRAAHAAVNDRDHYKSEADSLRAEVEYLRAIVAASATPKAVALLQREKADLLQKEKAELKKRLDELRPLIAAARRINPDDPPAAMLVLGRLADGLSPEDVRNITAMSAGDGLKVSIVPAGGPDPSPVPDWPPIITLSDASGYFFEPGSAEPSAEFRSKLSGSVVADMLGIIEKYKVDVIEVIGHTDEQPVRSPLSPVLANLDQKLIPFLSGGEQLDKVVPFDNAGLGLARAAAIVRILLQDARLQRYKILPLSAGQLILTDGGLSAGSPGDVRDRRRIEIRMRRSG